MKSELPSVKADRVAKEKAEKAAQKNVKEDALRRDLARTFSTGHGQRVLKWLKEECCFGVPILGINPTTGEIDEKRTTYQAMRLNLYLQIRNRLSFNILEKVEYHE